MDRLEIVWRLLVASFAVWRLSQLLFGESEAKDSGRAGEAVQDSTGVRFWADRALDLLCWVSVSLSSQTALWVACGFAGVLFSWVAVCGVSSLFAQVTGSADGLSRTSDQAEMQSAEIACVACGDGMQAHHG